MNAVFAEVLAVGFDGGTSDTDERVLWIAAPSLDVVRAALDGVPHAGLSEMTAAEVGDMSCIDFFLPDQVSDLAAALEEFAESASVRPS